MQIVLTTATSPLTTNCYRFYKDTSTGDYYLMLVKRCCGGDSDGDSGVRVHFTIYRRDSVIVFETEPQKLYQMYGLKTTNLT